MFLRLLSCDIINFDITTPCNELSVHHTFSFLFGKKKFRHYFVSRSVVACFCRCYYSFPFSCSQMSVLLCIYGWRARCLHFSPQKQILPYCVCGIIISNFFVVVVVCVGMCVRLQLEIRRKNDCAFLAEQQAAKREVRFDDLKEKLENASRSMVQQKKKEFSRVQHFTSRSMHVCKRTTESLCFSIEHISFSLVLCSHALSVISFCFFASFTAWCVFFCEQEKKMIEIKEKKEINSFEKS